MESRNSLSLKNLLQYCLGYVKLINPALSRYKIFTDPINPDYLDSNSFFSLDLSSNSRLPLNLKEFYNINPKDLDEDNKAIYEEQKRLATKLEEIKNKHRIDEYTKQINLNFGYFTVEVPDTESFVDGENADNTDENDIKYKIGEFPLFFVPVDIVVLSTKYYLEILDNHIIPNIGFLHDVLGEDAYFEFSSFINQLEIDEKLILPIKPVVLTQIWNELKAKLKLSDARFDENYFDLNKLVVSLSSKSNFFLTQDLKALTALEDVDLLDTSLGSWLSEDDLANEETINEDSSELLFPFDYDKYQLKVLGIINNEASIVQGPPGTGKSQTIANLLCHLAAKGKRVLFLSQKAQALKVVKDKLKTLKVDYLYGYMPNRFSPVYSPTEETDGASYTLAGIKEYIGFIHDRQLISTDDVLPKLGNTQDYFNESVGQQRTYFFLCNQITGLEKYRLNLKSSVNFLERFNNEVYAALKSLQKEFEEKSSFCGNYIKNTKKLKTMERKFSFLPSETSNYSEILEMPISEVERRGYEGTSNIGNVISDHLLLFNLKDKLHKLPREIRENFEEIVRQNKSRHQTGAELRDLQNFFIYKESLIKARELKEKIDISIVELGLDMESFSQLENLFEKEGFEKTISNCKNYLQLQEQIKVLKLENLNAINKKVHEIRELRKEKVINFLKNRLKQQIVGATYSKTVKGIVARISRALQKSKKAYRTFDQLKKDPANFQTIKELVPVWIMDLEDASRLIPLEKNMFDYIILDEASQCNLAYAIPAMYRSQHVIFFGDSEQMRDDSIKFKTNRSLIDLANKFSIPEHMQVKSKDDSVKSVLDIGVLCGFMSTTLLYHYRSPKELIGFSNENFYAPNRKPLEVINTNYLPYLDTKKVLINHFIKSTREQDISEKTNVAEAKYIARLIKELQSDEKTKDKSIAVLTFFNEQAFLLKQYIEDENIKISIVEGIQGDERDIIIYSFVICSADEKKRYIPLTGESGEINKGLNAGRVNVAFSRARMQVHCVTSMSIEEWPDGIWIKRYLEYVETNGIVNFYERDIKPFDSGFEEEFYHFVKTNLSKEFIVQNQVESCGFKIDFVITEIKSSRRLAIECDGPTHFEDEVSDIYVSSDIERQSILERAGWNFYRIAYSDWIDEEFNKSVVLNNIKVYFTSPLRFFSEIESLKIQEDRTEVGSDSVVDEVSVGDHENISQSETVTNDGNFKEICRLSIDEKRDLVASYMSNNENIIINIYFKLGSYVGYSNRGVTILSKDIVEFIDNSLKTLSNGESTSVSWKGSSRAKVMIQTIDDQSTYSPIDVRQYIETENYTGFTKKGFRLSQTKFKEFIEFLRTNINEKHN